MKSGRPETSEPLHVYHTTTFHQPARAWEPMHPYPRRSCHAIATATHHAPLCAARCRCFDPRLPPTAPRASSHWVHDRQTFTWPTMFRLGCLTRAQRSFAWQGGKQCGIVQCCIARGSAVMVHIPRRQVHFLRDGVHRCSLHRFVARAQLELHQPRGRLQHGRRRGSCQLKQRPQR